MDRSNGIRVITPVLLSVVGKEYGDGLYLLVCLESDNKIIGQFLGI